ncbi:MAG: adenylate kinase [Elusimicrobia bacterium]|nr:adenylate kinase [Elusimicrobiota bacterium]
MNIVLLGFPGSGKGTQAKAVSEKFSLLHLSTGDIFREAIASDTPLGLEVSDYLAAGRLVPDKLVLKIIKARLAAETKGLLFDGFPRTVEQAQGLDDYFTARNQAVDAALFLDVEEAEVVQRLGSRRTCPKCRKIYNLLSSPPLNMGLCDGCGGTLVLRDDDKPEVIYKRLSVYKDQTEPLVAYYRGLGNFHRVKGGRAPEEITAEISTILGNSVKT